MHVLTRCLPLVFIGLTIAACSGGSKETQQQSPAQVELEKALSANNCSACHNVTAKRIGPSMTDVAAKYSEADRAKLIASIRLGSARQWGGSNMAAQAHVSQETADALVTSILAIKTQ